MLSCTEARLLFGAPFLKSTFELRTAGIWLAAMYQIHLHHQQVVWKLESPTADYYLTKKGALHFSQA